MSEDIFEPEESVCVDIFSNLGRLLRICKDGPLPVAQAAMGLGDRV
jgi:hypothetical protein